jgi:hypothetical protein
MRMVIDSNSLRSAELLDYLSLRKTNAAVIPDSVFIEAYKGMDVLGVCQSMAIISEFPDQVIVLKPAMKCCGLHGRAKGLQRRLIDEGRTKNFFQYAAMYKQAANGHVDSIRQIMSDSRPAAAHSDDLKREVADLGERIDEFVSQFSKPDRARIRAGLLPSEDGMQHALHVIVTNTYDILQKHPTVYRWPKRHEVVNTFIFRACLCRILLAMLIGSRGSQEDTSIEKLANGQVDSFIAAYATYFDGVFSADKNLVATFAQACRWLEIFRRFGPTNS